MTPFVANKYPRVYQYYLQVRRQFAQYFIIGLSATALDILSLYLLTNFLHWRPVASVVLNQVFISLYVFLMNKYWTFGAKGMTHQQAFRFILNYFFNYCVSIVWMWMFNEKLGFNYLLVRICNIALAVSWNFLIYKYFVYKTNSTVNQTVVTPPSPSP